MLAAAVLLLLALMTLMVFRYHRNLGSFFERKISTVAEPHKMVLVIRQDLEMSKGKVAAQCCHACLTAYKKALSHRHYESALRSWEAQGQPKITLRVQTEKEMLDLKTAASKLSLITASIKDAGHTQVAPGTRTVLAIGPGPSSKIDYVCGHLKLY